MKRGQGLSIGLVSGLLRLANGQFPPPEAVIRHGPDFRSLAVIMQREPANPSVRILWGKQAEF